MFAQFTFPKPPRGKFSSLRDQDAPWEELLNALKSSLPAALVEVAQQPILKTPGVDSQRSVMGNMKDVIVAREICYQELDGCAAIEDDLGNPGCLSEGAVARMVKGKKTGRTCISAFPYEGYWEKIEAENLIPEDYLLLAICPNCNGSI